MFIEFILVAQILIVGSESEVPYGRPPLSKELWFREIHLDNVANDELTYVDWNGKPRA